MARVPSIVTLGFVAALAGCEPSGSNANRPDHSSFCVQACVEPYPIRPGPANLYFYCSPTRDSDLHGRPTLIGSPTIEAVGPIEELNEGRNVFRVPIEVKTSTASDASFGIELSDGNGTVTNIVPFHDGVPSVCWHDDDTFDVTDHRVCVPRKTSGLGETPVSIGYRADQLFHMGLEHAIAADEFQKIHCVATLRPFATDDELLAALEGGDVQIAVGVPIVAALATADYDRPRWRAYQYASVNAMTPFDGVLVSRDLGVASIKDLEELTIAVPRSSVMAYLLPQLGLQVRLVSDAEAADMCRRTPDARFALYASEPQVTLALLSDHYSLVGFGGVSRELFKSDDVPITLSLVSASWIEAHALEAPCVVATCIAIGGWYDATRESPTVARFLESACGARAGEALARLALPSGSSLWGSDKEPPFRAIKAALVADGRISPEADIGKLVYQPWYTDAELAAIRAQSPESTDSSGR